MNEIQRTYQNTPRTDFKLQISNPWFQAQWSPGEAEFYCER